MSRSNRTVFFIITVAFLSIAAYLCFGCDSKTVDQWRFNFAPIEATDFDSFVKISANSKYSPGLGFGWIDGAGNLASGRWPGDSFDTWETRDNLNVICRRSPDDLARSFAAGPASFAVDLDPGRYEVWVLTGDAGLLEYIPFEPYKIEIEGAIAYDYKIDADEFYRKFETPLLEDELSQSDAWRHYIAPRFNWVKSVVDLRDGQLTIRLDGRRRDRSILKFLGDYARTEIRGGPDIRFAGALNAVVIIRTGKGISGSKIIEEIDGERRADFNQKWPLKNVVPQALPELPAADIERGYTVFLPNPLQPAKPGDRKPSDNKSIKLRATPGEYVSITFGICPLKDLDETRVDFHTLHSASGDSSPPINIDDQLMTGVVRYVARTTGRGKRTWRPKPTMIVPTDSWNIEKDITKQFWLTYHVPDGMAPGLYTGEITVTPELAQKRVVEVDLEVLPFKLQRPAHLAVGMTYFSPVQYSFFGEERFWKRIEAEFKDMRAHNMTSVQYTGIRMDDYTRMGKAFRLYDQAGFENPVYLLESYGAMCRLRRDGIQWETEEFQSRYVQFIREFLDEAGRRNWSPIIINFGDEFTNEAIEEFGATVGKNLKKIPGIVTGADTIGYKEVKLLAPEVDILAFTNGWDGPTGVNRGKRLLKKETVDFIKGAGATPWLVNVAIDRFSNGYWFWKMVKLGVRGKMEWMYRGYNGMPFNSFDADPMRPMRSHIVYPGPDGTAIPSLNYEWMRMGLDDLAYLNTLEKAIEAAREEPAKRTLVEAADDYIKKLADSIEDDMNKYRDRQTKDRYTWPVERYDVIRSQVIDMIIQLIKK